MSYYLAAVIRGVIRENEVVNRFVLELNDPLKASPGQYVMAWRPGVGEIPLSIALLDGNNVTLVIEDVGDTSRGMNKLVVGDKMYLRGPYGRPFSLDRGEKYLLVAGGVGAAPLLFATYKLFMRGVAVDYVGGGRSSRFVLFKEELKKIVRNLFITTDDGTEGRKCSASELARELIGDEKYDVVLTCGPELMMYDVVKACVNREIYCEASVVRIIRCAHGICGSCVVEPGLLVCKDGPIFEGRTLINSEFGKFCRDEYGNKVAIS